ncbi:MAG: B12-binding domain-containing radical SAM protein [Pseudomonadota bacterium]
MEYRDNVKRRSLEGSGKRILFVNPAKQDNFGVNRIHMGFSIMGETLVSNGHEVKIMDYAFLRDLKRQIRVPDIEEVIDEFEPHVVGISVFTYLYDECQTLVARISRHCDLPIILGGPHFTIFPRDFADDSRISYIVRGEADTVILGLVEAAKRESWPVLVNYPLPSPDEIPAVNLDVAYGSQYLRTYQIQLSRGCPYNCSFCNVRFIAGRRVHARDLETCIDQIVKAKRRYPNIEVITITDDCPTFDKERFKRFLRMFREANLGCGLTIDNGRANLVDEEMIQLYMAAGGRNICLGAESGHTEVFEGIHKGESLEDIVNAAKLVRKYGLTLGLCFVIGLPWDNLERHSYSMRLAKALRPNYVFWNMCIPWPGTEVHQWYQTHGEIGDLRNFSTLIDPRANFRDPVCTSIDFPKEDRIKAWLMANMETHIYFSNPHDIWKLLSLTLRYKIYWSFAIYFARCFLPEVVVYSRYILGRIVRRALSVIRQLRNGLSMAAGRKD